MSQAALAGLAATNPPIDIIQASSAYRLSWQNWCVPILSCLVEKGLPIIAFDVDSVRFNYRVAGACMIDGHVLLHRADFEDFWSLPGGRGEALEPSRQTLARELKEELGADIEVGELLWIIEKFFRYGERNFHEVGLYYGFTVDSESPILDFAREHHGTEDSGVGLIFRWFPIKDLEQVRLIPKCLRQGLAHPPLAPKHIVEPFDAL